VNRSLFRLALRRLLLRRRSVLLALAPMLAALVAVVQAAGGTADAKSFASLMERLFLPTILACLALVIGSSAIGEERVRATHAGMNGYLTKPIAQEHCVGRDYTSKQGGKYAKFCEAYLAHASLEKPPASTTDSVKQGVSKGLDKLKGLCGR